MPVTPPSSARPDQPRDKASLPVHVADGPDPYSFTQDRPFIYHEWLGGTIMALAYRLGGATGLAVLKALLVLSLVGMVWFTLRHKQPLWRWAGVSDCDSR